MAKPQIKKRENGEVKKSDDVDVYVLGNFDREVDNPMGDGEPMWYEQPVDVAEAAGRAKALGVAFETKPGIPWTLYRIIMTLFYAHGQVDNVDTLERVSKIRRRIRDAEGGPIKVSGGELKFMEELAEKMMGKDSKVKLPVACWEMLVEEVAIARTMTVKTEDPAVEAEDK